MIIKITDNAFIKQNKIMWVSYKFNAALSLRLVFIDQ